jgi:hypothetical protein
MYIPGVIIFLVGSGQVRRWFRMRRSSSCIDASVISCKHVIKKDKKDREIYNYYDVVVEYRNPQTKHQERLAVKSPTEYALAQQVRMYQDKDTDKPVLMEYEDEFLFHPWVTMVGGALLIILALEENQGKEIPAMICLTVVLIGAGINLFVHDMALRKRNLQTIKAEIIEIYTRQISKETKILRGSKFTYYPVVRYELDGKENIRRCNINSSGANTFKVGESMDLYYDPKAQCVLEKHARTGVAVTGVILVAIGLLAGASILSVLI